MNTNHLFYDVTRSVSETLSYTNFEDRFPPCFDIWELICHFNLKTLLLTFLWLEFRFKLFRELHVHLKGFMCIRMRKLHEERQVPADTYVWCQTAFSLNVPKFFSKYLMTEQLSQIFGWLVRTLTQYIWPLTQQKPQKIKCNKDWGFIGDHIRFVFLGAWPCFMTSWRITHREKKY